MLVLDCFKNLCKERYNDVFFSDGNPTKNYTFGYIDDKSSRVYSYLDKHLIKAEDIVAIMLPRCVNVPISIIGIMKAGVAFVVIGERSDKETVSYILKETKPKLIIDEEVYNEMMECEPKSGYREPSLSDLAMVVFSSGSTGIFKGCMHEYGFYEKSAKDIKEEFLLGQDYFKSLRYGFTFGFYSASSIVSLVYSLVSGEYIDIVPYEVMEDERAFQQRLIDNRVTEVFLAPSKINTIDFSVCKNIKYVNTSYEMFSNLYLKNPILINCYGMTEALSSLTCFEVDKPYENTPVGYPLHQGTIKIIDECGNQVKNGEIGEICILSFYFRGYINNQKMTESVLKDGWYHTGDIGKFLPDDNLVVLGRKADILKTEEGYIIPFEISLAAVKALGLSWAYVKIFAKDEIYLYYCDNVNLDVEKVRNLLQTVLPACCLPTHCVKIDRIPYFASGKIDRKAFHKSSL